MCVAISTSTHSSSESVQNRHVVIAESGFFIACCMLTKARPGLCPTPTQVGPAQWRSSSTLCDRKFGNLWLPSGGSFAFLTPLVAPYWAIPRDCLNDTPLLRAMGFLVSQHGQLGARPPFPSLPLRERYLRDTL